jgi:uncharacterized membrane protein YqjE
VGLLKENIDPNKNMNSSIVVFICSIALVAYLMLLGLSYVPGLRSWLSRNQDRLNTVNSFVAVVTLVGVISSIVIFGIQEADQSKLLGIQNGQLAEETQLLNTVNSSTEAASDLEKENQSIYVANAKTEINDNLNFANSIIAAILNDEASSTDSIPLNLFSYTNLDKLMTFYPNQVVRGQILAYEIEIDKAGQVINILSQPAAINRQDPDQMSQYFNNRISQLGTLQIIVETLRSDSEVLLEEMNQ